MAGTDFVEWTEVTKINEVEGSTGKVDYLKLKSGESYRIRPVFKPIKFFKYFHKNNNKLRTAICEDPDICPIRDKYPELKKPSLRYACYVIDRADGKLKVIEAPQTVFRPMGSRAEATGQNPGSGKQGSDWIIKVTGAGLKTKYDVTFLDVTPLTKAEEEYIKEAVGGDKDSLKKIYAIDAPEKIEQKLFGDNSDNSDKKDDFASSSDEDDNISSGEKADFDW